MRKITAWVGVGLAAALLLAGLIAWQLSRTRAPEGLLSASGRIEGRITVVTPRASGLVVELRAEEGDRVAAGSVLALLDDPAIRSRLNAQLEGLAAQRSRLAAAERGLALLESQVPLQEDQAEAALRLSQAQRQRASAGAAQSAKDAARATDLVARRLIAEQLAEAAVLRATADREALVEAEAGVDQARKQLRLARLGHEQIEVRRAEREALARQVAEAAARAEEQRGYVEDFVVKSPIAGVVLTRNVEKGERVNAGTPLFTLADLDRLYLKVYVPESDLGQVILGAQARVYVDAFPDRGFAARVSRVANQAEFTPKNVETKEERVKLVFAVELAVEDNPDGVLKPGMPAEGVIRIAPDAAWRRP